MNASQTENFWLNEVNQILSKSLNLLDDMNDKKCYCDSVGKLKRVTCCKDNKFRKLETSKRENLLNKLKNLKPKCIAVALTKEDDYATEFSAKKSTEAKKMSYLVGKRSPLNSKKFVKREFKIFNYSTY